MTPKNFDYQFFFNTIITIILMIKKMTLISYELKQKNSFDLLCVLASEALQKAAGTKKMISRVIPSIFMKFLSRNDLDKLDQLTPQDVYQKRTCV